MFKLLRLVSKLSLLEDFYVLTGRKEFSPEESAELKSLTHSILKRLKEKDFTALRKALESHGGLETACVFFPTHERLGRREVVEPQLVLYRLFRLPQVRSSTELKRSPCCSARNGLDKKVCINPFHYSTIMTTGKLVLCHEIQNLLKATLMTMFVYEILEYFLHLICIRDGSSRFVDRFVLCDLFRFFLRRAS